MIDLERDELISLSQLARRIPSTTGRGVNPSSVFRWATKGVRGHRLEVVHVVGRMLTTWHAFVDFSAAVSSGRINSVATPVPLQARRVRDAKNVLRDAGIV